MAFPRRGRRGHLNPCGRNCVAAGFNQALGAFDAKVRDADVVFDLLVVGRGPDFRGSDAAFEVRDFLRPLVNQKNHDVTLRIIFEHAERHVPE